MKPRLGLCETQVLGQVMSVEHSHERASSSWPSTRRSIP